MKSTHVTFEEASSCATAAASAYHVAQTIYQDQDGSYWYTNVLASEFLRKLRQVATILPKNYFN